jgi:hypothetical protein
VRAESVLKCVTHKSYEKAFDNADRQDNREPGDELGLGAHLFEPTDISGMKKFGLFVTKLSEAGVVRR